MFLWAATLSRPLFRSLCTATHCTARRHNTTLNHPLTFAEISHSSTHTLIKHQSQCCVSQALAIRFSVMNQFDLAIQYLPQQSDNIDCQIMDCLVRTEFNPAFTNLSNLKRMSDEGANAGSFAPGEAREFLANPSIYLLALNGNVFALRRLILRHYYAQDLGGSHHFFNKAVQIGHSEDWLLGMLLGYGDDTQQYIDFLPENLDVTHYLKGQQLFEQGDYKKARQWFKKAQKQKLPGAQDRVEACEKATKQERP